MAKTARMQEGQLYNQEQVQLLLQERRRLNELIGTLDRAAACGIDCTMYRQMRDEIDKQLEAIYQNFMAPYMR